MSIFDPHTKDDLQKSQVELLQQKKHEFTFIGRERKKPGHTMFSYNTVTKEIKVAPLEFSKDIDFRTREPIQKPRIVIERNCVYRQALNEKNFIKKLKREGIIDSEES